MTQSKPTLGSWAVLGVFVPEGQIHPEDTERYLLQQWEGDNLFCLQKWDGPWACICNQLGECFRVSPEKIQWVPAPKFDLGEKVMNLRKRQGWIAQRCWHFKSQRYFYYLDILNAKGQRKRSKSRYFSSELKRLRP